MTDLDGLLKMDGYNDAILGKCVRFNTEFILYDLDKVILLLQRDGMTKQDAEEYWEFNMLGAWMGDQTPAFFSSGNKCEG